MYDKEGRLLLSNESVSKRVYTKQNAYIMTHMLSEVTEYGTARTLSLAKKMDVAGKTGTSGGDLDRVFVGYTPSLLAGIRVTSFDGNAIAGRAHSHITLWSELMNELDSMTEN